MQEIFQMLQCLLATISIEIISGTSIMISEVLGNIFSDILSYYLQTVNKPTHISGSLTDHLCNRKILMEEFFGSRTVENTIFQDYDAVRIVIDKNFVDLYTNP